jgi:hypothetical protein
MGMGTMKMALTLLRCYRDVGERLPELGMSAPSRGNVLADNQGAPVSHHRHSTAWQSGLERDLGSYGCRSSGWPILNMDARSPP